MIRKYLIKLYDKEWALKDVISEKIISNQISFWENMNWWQGNINLSLNLKYYDTTFQETDIVEVREALEDKTVIATYTWVVETIGRTENSKWQQLTVSILWVCSILNDNLYKDSWNLSFSKSDTATNILKDIIDKFQTDYGAFGSTENLTNDIIRYTGSSIATTSETLNIEFSKQNYLQAIKKVIESTNLYFYIWPDWVFYAKEKSWTPEHYLTFEKDLIEIKQNDTKKDLVNKLYLEREWGTVKIYQDTGNQTTYWIKEKFLSKTDLKNEDTQDEFWINYINENARIVSQVQIQIKATSWIIPWETISTLNTTNPINNLQIVKISKWLEKDTLHLDKLTNLWETILKLNN